MRGAGKGKKKGGGAAWQQDEPTRCTTTIPRCATKGFAHTCVRPWQKLAVVTMKRRRHAVRVGCERRHAWAREPQVGRTRDFRRTVCAAERSNTPMLSRPRKPPPNSPSLSASLRFTHLQRPAAVTTQPFYAREGTVTSNSANARLQGKPTYTSTKARGRWWPQQRRPGAGRQALTMRNSATACGMIFQGSRSPARHWSSW